MIRQLEFCQTMEQAGNKTITVLILSDGLKNLEYKGYSSTGIAVMNHAQIVNDILFTLPVTVE